MDLTPRQRPLPVSTSDNPLTGRKSPLLCYVTDRRSLHGAALTQKIEEIAVAGVDWVQIREKDLPARELASLARKALDIAANVSAKRASAIRVFVNDRLDVAIAERAHGVHLGEASLPVAELKRLIASAMRKKAIEEPFLVGVSCHSLEAAQAAQRDGADCIFFGPIFATPSKERFGPPQGVERLAQVCRGVTVPVLAIGGITLENANSCIAAGATGIAAIRLFQDPVDPVLAMRRLRQAVSFPRQLPADRKPGR